MVPYGRFSRAARYVEPSRIVSVNSEIVGRAKTRRGESKITSPLHRIFLKLYLLHEGGMVLSHIHFQPNFLSTNPLMRARRAHALSARPCTLRARATPQNRSRCGSGSIGRPLLVVPLSMRRAHGMGGTPWPWQLPKRPSRAAPNSYRRSRMRPPHTAA